MRIGILTTDTAHHRFFLRELAHGLPESAGISIVLFETRSIPARRLARKYFATSFPNIWKGVTQNPYLFMGRYAQEMQVYEYGKFFPDGDNSVPASLNVHTVSSVNDRTSMQLITDAGVDVMFVYGTGLVKREVFSIPHMGTVNAHGGLLPRYRGLDTNLWAALEGHPEEMAVTLHTMEDDFDSGAIFMERRIPPHADLAIHTLRYHTAVLCTEMCLELISDFCETRTESHNPVERESRYYRPMPALLKPMANRALRHYAASLLAG